MRLSDTKVKNAKHKDKDYMLSDGDGLYISVKSAGYKRWEFIYTSPVYKKRRKTTIGRYPTITLKMAREKAQEYNRMIFNGVDPIDEKNKQEREKIILDDSVFENVVKEWLDKRKDELAKRTYEKIDGLFRGFVIPAFKNTPIKDITRKDVVKLIETKAKQAPETASRMTQYLNRIWLYAINKEYCDRNIIADIDRKSIIPKRQTINYPKITDMDIFSELVNAIYDYSGHYSVRNVLRFVLHIPLRAKNLINLKWDNIDFKNRVLTIPREEMKDRNINLPDFTMPLTDEVIDILKEQLFFAKGCKYVFIAGADIPINQETPNRALQRMGFNDAKRGRKQRLHSFRGTFRSLADTYQKEHNADEIIKEIALDHHSGSMVKKAYTNRADYLSQLRPLMEWWSDFVVKTLS